MHQNQLVELNCSQNWHDFFFHDLLTYSYDHLRLRRKGKPTVWESSDKRTKKFEKRTSKNNIPQILDNYHGNFAGPDVAAMLLYLAENCETIVHNHVLKVHPTKEASLFLSISETMHSLFFSKPFHDPTEIYKQTLHRIRPITCTPYLNSGCYVNVGREAVLCTLM